MQHVYVSCPSLGENEQHDIQHTCEKDTQEKIIISNEHAWKPWQPARSKIRGEQFFNIKLIAVVIALAKYHDLQVVHHKDTPT